MISHYLLLISCLLLSAFQGVAGGMDQVRASLLPRPCIVEPCRGTLRLSGASLRLHTFGADTNDFAPALEDLRRSGVRSDIRFGILGGEPAFDRLLRDEVPRLPDTPGGEGYILRVRPEGVLIAARGPAGLFYGAQTLLQLIDGAGRQGSLPCLRIIDWPSFRYRGIMDDISRGPVPTADYMQEQIRRCARMKINLFTHYVEHVVATDSHPGFAPAGGALTIDEWRSLAAFARRYHVTLVGSFQSFGHFQNILAHPSYAHLGEGGSLISPVLKESYDFLADVYREMVPAFTAPWFNINCDETFDLGKGASRPLVDSLGKGRVYAAHVHRLYDTLAVLGVRTMIWGDILLQHPEAMRDLPKDLLVITWNYDNRPSFQDLIEPLRDAGFELWIAPGVLNSRSLIPHYPQTEGNIRGFLRDARSFGLAGVMTTVWDDGGTALFGQDWYGVALAADQSWHVDPDDTTFVRRFDWAVYGDHGGAISSGLRGLMEIARFAPTDNMNDRVLPTPALPTGSEPLSVSLHGWDSVESAAKRADILLASAESVRWEHDRATLRYTAALYKALARNRLDAVALAGLYGQAVGFQAGKGARVRPILRECLAIAGGQATAWEALARSYRGLWLHENRVHALEIASAPLQSHAAAWRGAEQHLIEALARSDRGEPLLPPSTLGLDIRVIDGWYFREWLVAGPIDGADLEGDYLVAMGGEAAAQPGVTQEFTAQGATHRWRRKASADIVEFRFDRGLPDLLQSTFYAFATLESPRDQRVNVRLGSAGAVALFVNGARVHSYPGLRRLTPDEDACAVDLRKGRNSILVKVMGRGGDEPGFTLRLPDLDIRNSKNRYRIHTAP